MTTLYRTLYAATPGSSNTTTQYLPVSSGYFSFLGTEASTQRKWKRAATFKNLRVYISANSASTTTAISFRVNGSSGACTVSISAGATGWFEDSTNSVSVSVDDLIDIEILRGDASSIVIKNVQISELTTDNSVVIGAWTATAQGLGTASATRYISGAGLAVTINATESTIGIPAYFARAATASKMLVNISSNARSTTTTYSSRKNGVGGNQTVSVTSGATGWFYDSANTDSISAGDYFNYKVVTSTGTGTISAWPPYCIFTDATDTINIIGNGTGNLNTNQTRYIAPSGGTLESTEANAEIKMRGTGTISKVQCSILTNTSDQNGTYTIRKNRSDTAITFTVTAGSSANAGDTSNSVTYADGDTISLTGVRAAGGSGTITLDRIFWALTPDAETSGSASFAPYYYRMLGNSGSGMNV